MERTDLLFVESQRGRVDVVSGIVFDGVLAGIRKGSEPLGDAWFVDGAVVKAMPARWR